MNLMKTYPPLNLIPLAEKFSVNLAKPLFPLNTLRMFYLMLVRDITDGDDESLTMMISAVPKLSAFAEQSRALSGDDDAESLHEHLEEARNELYKVVDTPQLRFDIEVTWQQQIYFYQQTLLENFARQSTEMPPEAAVLKLLQLRAVDHFLYAQTLSSILSLHDQRRAGMTKPADFHPRLDVPSVIRQCISTISQINDLVDAVCYAESDLQAGRAVIIDAARREFTTPEDVEQTFRSVLNTLQQRLTRLALSSPAYENVQTYGVHLARLFDGQRYDGA